MGIIVFGIAIFGEAAQQNDDVIKGFGLLISAGGIALAVCIVFFKATF